MAAAPLSPRSGFVTSQAMRSSRSARRESRSRGRLRPGPESVPGSSGPSPGTGLREHAAGRPRRRSWRCRPPEKHVSDPRVQDGREYLARSVRGRGQRRARLSNGKPGQPRGLGHLHDGPAAVAGPQPPGRQRPSERVVGWSLLPLQPSPAATASSSPSPPSASGARRSRQPAVPRPSRSPRGACHLTDDSDPLNESGASSTRSRSFASRHPAASGAGMETLPGGASRGTPGCGPWAAAHGPASSITSRLSLPGPERGSFIGSTPGRRTGGSSSAPPAAS